MITQENKMPRKFYYGRKAKRFERKKRATSVKTLISLPIVLYFKTPVKTVVELIEKINISGLPTGWTHEHQQDSRNLVLTRVIWINEEYEVMVMIKINEKLDIELKLDGKSIEVEGISSTVTSLQVLYCVLNEIENKNVCKGNLVDEYIGVINEDTPTQIMFGKSISSK